MAAGRERLSKVQLGKETVAGTAVPATALWRGGAIKMDDQRTLEEIEEHIGILEGADRTAITQLLGGIEFPETPATFEQIQYLLAAGFGGPTTGSADGPGTDKIYTTTVPTTSVPAGNFYTIEAGDDHEVEQLEYAAVTKISISGKIGETIKMSATWIGRQVSRLGAGFTGAIAIPTVEELIGLKTKVYLDAVGGTYGTTQVSSTVIGFKIDIEIMWVADYTMDGNLYFTRLAYNGHKITGELTYRHDTAAAGSTGAKKFFRDQTAKLLQLKVEGSAPATPGTTYTVKTFIANLPIKFSKPGILESADGSSVVTMAFRSRYNVTAGNAGSFITTPELATLP